MSELDRMLEASVIEPVKESEWISAIVVQDKNTSGEVRTRVDLRKLNDYLLHDPFLAPFTDEVLESVRGQKMYLFIDGFFGYHQIRIGKEYRHKTTFVMEWGCFQYTNSQNKSRFNIEGQHLITLKQMELSKPLTKLWKMQ